MIFNTIKEKAVKTEIRFWLWAANNDLKRAREAKDLESFNKHMKSFKEDQSYAMDGYNKIKKSNKDRIINCRVKFEGAKA